MKLLEMIVSLVHVIMNIEQIVFVNLFKILIWYLVVKYYFFIIKFQSRGLPHDHWLLWVQNAPTFGVSKSEEIECFVDKYLTTNQIMFSIEIHNIQIHQHKRTCKKKTQQIYRFQYPKPPMKHTKILLPFSITKCVLVHSRFH
jgi:hypothetical protein